MAAQFQLTARRVSAPAGMSACLLGESPMWDEEHQALWWIDILGEVLYVAQPSQGGTVCDFDRVAVLPLPGHRPGFIVHAGTPSKCGAVAQDTPATPYHAVWGSETGLYYTSYGTQLPWRTSGHSQRLPQLEAATTVPHRALAPFPLSCFPLQGGRVYRFNDGKVGPDGSLWCGGMMERTSDFPKRDAGCGALLQWRGHETATGSTAAARAAKFRVGVPAVTVSNGMGWSRAGDVLYHVDTPSAVIRAYPYDAAMGGGIQGEAGSVGYVFWALPPELQQRGATLDGLCVDASGAVWVALAGIGEVVRLQARKVGVSVEEAVAITGVVKLPEVTLGTSCCFGGADLCTLFITTARGTSKEAAEKCRQDGAGWIYAANMQGIAKGMPASRLRLPRNTASPPAPAPTMHHHL